MKEEGSIFSLDQRSCRKTESTVSIQGQTFSLQSIIRWMFQIASYFLNEKRRMSSIRRNRAESNNEQPEMKKSLS